MKVKWFEFKLGQEEIEEVTKNLESGWISGTSPKVKEFERLVSKETGAKYAIACMNGTTALITSFLAFKRYLNKELIIGVPTWTYIATVNSADLIGTTKMIDCNKRTFNMLTNVKDINLLAPADVGGLPCDYDSFSNIPIVADAAESMGANYKGRRVGTLADISIFSFYVTKIITTGEGGMILTDNSELAKISREIVDQGYGPKGHKESYHPVKGYNFRMTSMQASLGCIQIKRLQKRLEHKRNIAKIYHDIIGDKVEYQHIPKDRTMTYYLFTILVKKRDKTRSYLSKSGIETRIWRPVHMQPPYSSSSGFPNADKLYKYHIHLPIHNMVTEEQAKYVGEKINEFI